MSDDQIKPEFPDRLEVTAEQYMRMKAAAALRGMTVEEWAISSLNEHVEEQMEIEAHRRRHGLKVFRPEDETA